jgi:hypothetical protein
VHCLVSVGSARLIVVIGVNASCLACVSACSKLAFYCITLLRPLLLLLLLTLSPSSPLTLLHTLQQPNCRLDWQSLAGVRLWQLCVGRGSHSRVARLLSALVGPQSGLDPLSAADTYAAELRRRCYGFFSEGDVLTYEGLKDLRRYTALHIYYYLYTAC